MNSHVKTAAQQWQLFVGVTSLAQGVLLVNLWLGSAAFWWPGLHVLFYIFPWIATACQFVVALSILVGGDKKPTFGRFTLILCSWFVIPMPVWSFIITNHLAYSAGPHLYSALLTFYGGVGSLLFLGSLVLLLRGRGQGVSRG